MVGFVLGYIDKAYQLCFNILWTKALCKTDQTTALTLIKQGGEESPDIGPSLWSKKPSKVIFVPKGTGSR